MTRQRARNPLDAEARDLTELLLARYEIEIAKRRIAEFALVRERRRGWNEGFGFGVALTLAIVAIAAVVLLATPAGAQEQCGPAQATVDGLAARFGETQRTGGLRDDTGTFMATFANAETGTWTILEIRPDGVACMVASGQGWSEFATRKGEPA